MGYSVQQIVVYPVKACRGVNVPCAAITSTGLLYDREWMVVSADKGRLIAQAKAPRLASVQPTLPLEAFKGEKLKPDASLEIRAPGMPVLEVPLIRRAKAMDSDLVSVNIYGWDGVGVDEGVEASSWWSTYLDRPVRFVRFNPALVDRQVQYAPEGFKTGFSNISQFLLASQASLEHLNERLDVTVKMNRFRPNLVINGPPAYEEDRWERFSIVHDDKNLHFSFDHSCPRCKVPTINQEDPQGTGEEPLKTLGTYRTGEILKPKVGGAKQSEVQSDVFPLEADTVFFGTYFVSDDTLPGKGVTGFLASYFKKPSLVAVNDPLFVSEFRD